MPFDEFDDDRWGGDGDEPHNLGLIAGLGIGDSFAKAIINGNIKELDEETGETREIDICENCIFTGAIASLIADRLKFFRKNGMEPEYADKWIEFVIEGAKAKVRREQN